jgi:hypothetical protein
MLTVSDACWQGPTGHDAVLQDQATMPVDCRYLQDLTCGKFHCRYGHVAVPLHDSSTLALYGGGDADEDRYEADLALLDTRTWRWTTPLMQVIMA